MIPDIIKIDIEGAELKALKGGLLVLQSFHPILICELAPETRTQVLDFLGTFGYSFYNADTLSENTSDAFNVLCLPDSFSQKKESLIKAWQTEFHHWMA